LLFTEQKLLGLMSKERQQDLLTLKDLIEAGKFTPVIDRTFPLSEAPQAIRYLEQSHTRGKVVLTVSKRTVLRACADRSWSARRSALPTIAAPCLPASK
jgi:Zinc-binding dehydrogenase